MSVEIDEVINYGIDAVVNVAELAIGAAAAIVGGTIAVIKGLAQTSGIMAKSLISSINEFGVAVKETNQLLNDIKTETKALEMERLALYQQNQHETTEKKEVYLETLINKTDLSEFFSNQQAVINYLDQYKKLDEKIKNLEKVISIKYELAAFSNKIKSSQEAASYYPVDIEKYIKLYNQLSNLNNYKSLDELLNVLKKADYDLTAYMDSIKTEIAKNMLDRDFKQIYFVLNHQTSEPLLTIFKSEYNSLILNKNNEEEKKILIKEEILKIKENIIYFMEQINGLNLMGAYYDEAKTLFEAAIMICQDQALPLEKKLEALMLREALLKEYIIKIRIKYNDVLAQKEQYDQAYQIYYYLCDYYNITPQKFIIKQDNINIVINQLNNEVDKLFMRYQKDEKIRQMSMKIRETINAMHYQFIGVEETILANTTIHKEYFAVGNGNVLIATLTSDGKINYQVAGVAIPGFAMDKKNIENKMHEVCPKVKALKEILAKLNCTIVTTKLYGPADGVAREIKLPEHIAKLHMNRFIQERKGIIEQTNLKHQVIDE